MAPSVIFDLDNCLSSAAEVGVEIFQPALDAITAANDGSVSTEVLQQAFSDMWTHAYDWVARRHNFTDEMFAAGWREFSRIAVSTPMKGYPDLRLLSSLSATLFLVTTGFRRLQESKISCLGIAKLFREVHVDAIDEPERVGKAGLFQQIIQRNGLVRREVYVVGDNPESELKAGRMLELQTVQILRPGVEVCCDVDHHIAGLAELPALLRTP